MKYQSVLNLGGRFYYFVGSEYYCKNLLVSYCVSISL